MLRRVALHRYLADKIQCVVERIEARDLVDIAAVLRARPQLEAAWTDAAIRDDLRAYRDVDPGDAIAMRDRLLALLRSSSGDAP